MCNPLSISSTPPSVPTTPLFHRPSSLDLYTCDRLRESLGEMLGHDREKKRRRFLCRAASSTLSNAISLAPLPSALSSSLFSSSRSLFLPYFFLFPAAGGEFRRNRERVSGNLSYNQPCLILCFFYGRLQRYEKFRRDQHSSVISGVHIFGAFSLEGNFLLGS